jgi:hypothetical protein
MPSGQRCLLHSVPPAPHLDPEEGKLLFPAQVEGRMFFSLSLMEKDLEGLLIPLLIQN